MKRALAFCLSVFAFVAVGKAQLYDNTWVCGNYAGTVTFNIDSIDTAAYIPHIPTRHAIACISDKEGNFQFFTEGVNVYSADGTPMVNGQQLADNSVNAVFYTGLTDGQNVMILPKKDNQYYIIYQSQTDPDFAVKPWWYTNVLYYSIVDMSLQNGKGEVIKKREPVNSTYFMDGHLTACQHANGRDWWLVQRGYNNNRYFIYIVTPDSISLVREQFIGAVSYEPDAVGQSAFSPDGNRYATITGKSALILLDFDRCDGVFTNPQKVNIPIDTFMFYGQQQIVGAGGDGLCFSPNSRFIYVNSLYVLRQYDLFQNPIDSSEQVIFFWTDSNEQLGQFDQMHLAPNGKIYIANYMGFTNAIHVINYPDQSGVACGFVKSGLPIATNNAYLIPNMVHFRMGALIGSGCDTIISTTQNLKTQNQQARIQPNPANKYVYVEMPMQGNYIFELLNETGQLIAQKETRQVDIFNTENLPSGIYYLKVRTGSGAPVTGAQKIVVQH